MIIEYNYSMRKDNSKSVKSKSENRAESKQKQVSNEKNNDEKPRTQNPWLCENMEWGLHLA